MRSHHVTDPTGVYESADVTRLHLHPLSYIPPRSVPSSPLRSPLSPQCVSFFACSYPSLTHLPQPQAPISRPLHDSRNHNGCRRCATRSPFHLRRHGPSHLRTSFPPLSALTPPFSSPPHTGFCIITNLGAHLIPRCPQRLSHNSLWCLRLHGRQSSCRLVFPLPTCVSSSSSIPPRPSLTLRHQ